jgi:hypothetical protein
MAQPSSDLGPLSRQERYKLHVDWLDRHLSDFGRTEGVSEIQQIQRNGELALALRARVLTEKATGSSGWSSWQNLLIEHLDRTAIRQRSRNQLSIAHAWLMPYVILNTLGLWADPWHDETLAAARRHGFPEALEVVPYRKADHLFFLQLADPSRQNELDAAIARTYLAFSPTIVYADRDAAYSVTHTILYASSFGLSPLPDDWPFLRVAEDFVESALLRFARRCDWDLVGELLICMKVLPAPNPELVRRAEARFTTAVRGDGAVFPSAATAHSLVGAPPRARDADFEAMYHTTLVGLFLAASASEVMSAPAPRAWRGAPGLRVEAPKSRAAAYLAKVSVEHPDVTGAGTAVIGWDDALNVDRVKLASTLRDEPARHNDPEVLVALATVLAAERDYANLIGTLGWLLELRKWDDRAEDCLQFLLDHQLPDGRIGLLDSSLASADELTRATVHSTLAKRFVRLCARVEAAQRREAQADGVR